MALRDDVSDRAEARLGTTLKGKWSLDRVLGVGGMATVYAATHRNQNRVAIKMLHPEVALDAEVTKRFLREGYVANSVNHPGTVKILDDDVTEDGAPFLVMELLLGETLESRWQRKGESLPVAEVLPIAEQLLDVLATAHVAGIVHRDIKPENLFLTTDGRVKVLDFGIARLRELSGKSAAGTRAGSLLGTPAFMAPEQARGRWDEVDERTDLWGVGATLFTLLTGTFVHDAETVNEQLILSATTPAPSLGSVMQGLPDEVVALVDRALAYDKADRFPSASAMQAAARAAMASPSFEAPPSVPRASVVLAAPSDTLTAAPAMTSVRSGRPNDTLATDQVMLRSAEGRGRVPVRRGRVAVWLAGLGAAALVVVGAFALRAPSSASAGSSAEPLEPRVVPAAQPAKTPEAAEPAPVEAPLPPSAPSAAPGPSAPRPPPVAHKPAATGQVKPAASGGRSPEPTTKGLVPPPHATTVKPAASANPFDRRF